MRRRTGQYENAYYNGELPEPEEQTDDLVVDRSDERDDQRDNDRDSNPRVHEHAG